MTAQNLAKICDFKILSDSSVEPSITGIYCGDLLSIVMSKAKEGNAWVTVMGNVNSVAVATLTEMSCIVLSCETTIDEDAFQKAKEKQVIILQSSEPIFETSLKIYEAIKNE